MASHAAKSTLRFLTLDQVKKLHHIYVGTTAPSRDTLLNSALDAPMNKQHYEGEQDPIKLASVLATRIIKNHAFMDGNKRTALLAANVFLKINGKMLDEEAIADGQDPSALTGSLTDTKDDQVKELLAAAHSAVATNDIDEVGLAEQYGKVVVVSSVTADIERFREASN
ncbi:MAG: hypothetical protein Q9198_008318 [Flavoplaca austrocitrina]